MKVFGRLKQKLEKEPRKGTKHKDVTNHVLGGKRAAIQNKENYGEDFYKVVGSLGGKSKTANTHKKGFGTHRDKASEAGRKGGAKSRLPGREL